MQVSLPGIGGWHFLKKGCPGGEKEERTGKATFIISRRAEPLPEPEESKYKNIKRVTGGNAWLRMERKCIRARKKPRKLGEGARRRKKGRMGLLR